ncbi:Pfs domain protein [Beauveria brongniartii RCEF 3172]|uniref:Pfs domain protein n=1 Tax=Beauveria brongniartii RCEF 3172 TaxID=1081107 RepID=A0A162KHA4_9HYPO|nr:Pfs domain protein [Beauveria brongniartii RCEF 3172]
MITGGAVLTPGVKELPPHLTRNGTIPQLKWLSKRYIVFWDEEVKRGWLVNGTSALLHIMRASLAQSEHDDSSACLLFDKSKMNNFPDKSYKHNTAMRVLIDQGNQGLVVYPDSISQTRKTSADSGNSTNTQTSTFFLFGDLAKKHFAALEQMIDHHSHLAGRDGINLKIRLRKHLEGWDFADLVNEIRPQPHVATIPTLGHGWIDFVRSIEAITLFGRKFGELLQPASRTGLCDRWSSLPQQDYLLAASVADLTSIMEQYGDPHAAPRELARNIIWHSPADTFAACPCKLSQASRHEKAAAYHIGPVQVLLPSGRLPPASGQRELEPDGAVAFGHNAIFGYRWPEKGTDEVPAKDFLVPLRNMLPVRLSKPQAESLDTLDSSETGVASRIDSESSTSTPWVESPPSLRSSLRSLIPKRRSCTLQEENETVKKKLKTK